MNERAKDMLTILVIFACFTLYHREVVFSNKMYYNMWSFRHYAPFPESKPSEINPLNQNSDAVTHYFPHKAVVQRNLRHGKFTLWTPYVFSGYPLYANGSSAVFSPFNLLFVPFSLLTAYKLQLGIWFSLSIVLTFWFLRSLGITRISSALGCGVILFCPFLMEFIDFDTVLPFVWSYPLVLLCAEYLHKKVALPLTALALALTVISSHIQTAIYTFALFISYAMIFNRRWKIVGAVLLALALSGFAIYPFLIMYQNSQWMIIGSTAEFRLPLTPITAFFPLVTKLPHFSHLVASVCPIPLSPQVNIGLVPFLFGGAASLALFSKTTPSRIRYFILMFIMFHVFSVYSPHQLFAKFWQVYIFSSAVLTAWVLDKIVDEIK